MSGKLLTIKDVAQKLQVAEVTVRKWQEQGKITFIKLPQGIRIREEWLETWLNNKTIKAKKIA
jgi:excisionase family DNA binding protein